MGTGSWNRARKTHEHQQKGRKKHVTIRSWKLGGELCFYPNTPSLTCPLDLLRLLGGDGGSGWVGLYSHIIHYNPIPVYDHAYYHLRVKCDEVWPLLERAN